jgi:beta-glucosidase
MTVPRFLSAACCLAVLFVSVVPAQSDSLQPVFRNPNAPLAARVNDLFNRLTEHEKLSLLTGTNFTSRPIPRLGLPGIAMADAGQGVRGGMPPTTGPATAFPAEVTMASSWDRHLLWQIGEAIGNEARNKGTGVQMELGPAVNIHRSPLCGRDSEYMGEDPFLTANLAVSYIKGMQSTGTLACVKHFACNNEEDDRGYVNVIVDERTLREIYLPAFEAAVKQGHVASIMAAYNRVNGPYCSANWYLLHDILRTDWGFDGLAVSDWGAVHSLTDVVNGGLDLEMPGPGLVTASALQIALKQKEISQGEIDHAVRDILRAMIRAGVVNPVQHVPDNSVVGSLASQQVANQAALEGMVLLKNQGKALPINPTASQKIVVIGPRAKNWQMDSYGSPSVQPTTYTDAYDGIAERVAGSNNMSLSYYPAALSEGTTIPTESLFSSDGDGHGLSGAYFNNTTLSGPPVAARIDPTVDFVFDDITRPAGVAALKFSARWTGSITAPSTGDFVFTVRSDDGCRLWIGGKHIIDDWNDQAATTSIGRIHLMAGQSYALKLEYYQNAGDASITLGWLQPSDAARVYQGAAEAAKSADVAVVCVGSETEGEGTDRTTMHLPDQQDLLIETVAAANPHTIVVLNNGGPVLVGSWINSVPAVLEAGFPGETGGKALASILFGDVNPSGKLVDTYGMRRQDYPDYGNFPGVNGKVHYREGIYVGYRAFDKRHIVPQFPFGYGLSYTTFHFSGLGVSQSKWNAAGTVRVTANVTNTGKLPGAEIAELYIEPRDPKIDRPIRELKGFNRVDIAPGQTMRVSFALTPRDFAYCDVPGKRWRADKGNYVIEIGSSSRDILLSHAETLTKTWTQPIPGMGAKDPYAPKPSLNTGKHGTASSDYQGHFVANAFDGDPGTRWESKWSDPQWIKVDLGKSQFISLVELTWETANASAFQIQVSNNNVNWHTVYSTTNGQGGYERIEFPPVKARYVRMYGTKRATKYGYSLYSFDVYKK